MARPTKCTKRFRYTYCQAIRDGLSYESAAAEAGVFSESTILDWRARGEAGEEPFATFSRDEKRAVADWERKRLEAMDAAGPNWPREAWKLERRMPDTYGRKERVEHVGDGGGPVKIEHGGTAEVIDDPGLRALAAELVARASGGAAEPCEPCAQDEPGPVADGSAPEAAQ